MALTIEMYSGKETFSNHLDYTVLFNNYYNDNRSEQLVMKADLQSAGLLDGDIINAIQYYITELPSGDLENVRVGIKHSSKTSLNSGAFEAYNTYQEVFNSATILNNTLLLNDWNTLQFASDFVWNGTDNIIITLIKDSSTYTNQSGRISTVNLSEYAPNHYFKSFRSDSTHTFPFDNANCSTNPANPSGSSTNNVPRMKIIIDDRLNRTYNVVGSALASATTTAIPKVLTHYAKSTTTTSATTSSMPTRVFAEPNTIIKKDLVRYWNAKQGVTTTNWNNIAPDTLATGHATITGAVPDANGLFFDGIDDVVDIPNIPSASLQSNITIEFWININEDKNVLNQFIVSTSSSASIRYFQGKFIFLYGSNSSQVSNIPISNNTYYHVVYRVNGFNKTIKFTVNGSTETFNDNLASTINWADKPITISKNPNSPADAFRFKGTVPLLRIYNRVLDDDEVLHNLNKGYEIALTAPSSSNPPAVTSIIADKSKISDENGMNQSIITVQFDTDVTAYEARLNGTDNTTGVLVHSGGAVSANTDATVIIDWNELTTEGQNRINIYGQNANGWTPYTS